MICTECGGPIHPERIAVKPNAKTCSAECRDKRKAKLRKAAVYRLRERRKAARSQPA